MQRGNHNEGNFIGRYNIDNGIILFHECFLNLGIGLNSYLRQIII